MKKYFRVYWYKRRAPMRIHAVSVIGAYHKAMAKMEDIDPEGTDSLQCIEDVAGRRYRIESNIHVKIYYEAKKEAV